MQKFSLQATVSIEQAGSRLDQVAAILFPDYSRARLQQWIKDGLLLVDGVIAQNKQKLYGGELISLSVVVEHQEQWEPEDLPIDIVYEDSSLLIINKPAGLVVHPAAGNYTGTLLNALLHHYEVSREYQAIVNGLVTAGGTVEAALGRHPVHRTKRAVVSEENGKNAITHYRILKKFRAHSHLQVKLETGRTHQIRVHMAHIGFPLVGDLVYGGRLKLPKGASPELIASLSGFKRQALHAWRLGLQHPVSGESMQWELEIPSDMQELLAILADDYAQ